MSNKLILGTAAFGSDYGIKHDGQPSIKELEKIARIAWDGGIRVIHTSWQYGNLPIIEKCFPKEDFEWIKKDRTNPELAFWNDWLGISIYEPKLTYANSFNYLILPVNILDNRFMGWIKAHDIPIIARSVFLQGLLLMEDQLICMNWYPGLPEWVQGEAKQKIQEFHRICKIVKLKPYEAALGWVLGLKEVDHVIVGVNSAEQLAQLLEVKPLQWDYDFSITDENVLDPRRWPTEKKLPNIEFLRKHSSINYG